MPPNTSSLALNIIVSPFPPASTTPDFFNTGSISGVFLSVASADSHTVLQKRVSSFVELWAFCAVCAAALTTVRIVPSVGVITALYAASAPSSSAFAI